MRCKASDYTEKLTMQTINIPTAELVNITELKSDGQNPNRMTPKQHQRLQTSIEKYGFIVPIITNKDLLIADGEQRYTVAQSLGMTQVPVIRLPVEDVNRRLLRQILNKLKGEHDLIGDAEEFQKIIDAGKEEELKYLLDLSDSDLEKYLIEIQEIKEEIYQVPDIETVETNIQLGDIFQIGSHKLMCGDALKDVEILMGNTSPDTIFIDIPYGIDYSGGRTQVVRTKSYGRIKGDETPDIIKFVEPFTKTQADLYVCASPINFYPVLQAFTNDGGYTAIIIWKKNSPGLGYQWVRRYCEFIVYRTNRPKHKTDSSEFDWWEIPTENRTTYVHGTQKPTRLIHRAIRLSNSKIVADYFGGSGSTLIACEQTGRVCYMMEIDPRYCQVIIDRWESYTGQKAVKLTKT